MPLPPTEAEITAIYRETVVALYGFVSRRCGGERQLAEDITQEAWLRAVRDWRRSGVPDSPIAWLMTVSRNLLLNHLRRRPAVGIDAVPPDVILDALERDAALREESVPLAALTERSGEVPVDVAAAVTTALARLPSDEAHLLEAFHFERHRVKALAARMGITERAVEGRLRRARERLRGELLDILPSIEGGVI
jgi:RNA polymerase sigma-70 factor (ECF subfamily)